MAKIHGVAGEWARIRGMALGLWPLAIGIFSVGFSLAMWILSAIPWAWVLVAWAWVLVVASLALIAWSALKGVRRIERFYVGARGEERVSLILRGLDERFHVFNDFIADGTHVDHVVAGPTGVFAIETKFWNGMVSLQDDRILVDGEPPTRSPIKQAQHECNLVKTHLSKLGWNGIVTPVLVFASNTFIGENSVVHGVNVLNSVDLANIISSSREILSVAELERLVTIMETSL